MNRAICGFRNFHYCLKDGSRPVAVPGAIKLSRDPDMQAVTVSPGTAGPGTEYTVGYRDKGIRLSLEVVSLPQSFLLDVLGCTLDSNGVLVENGHPFVHFALLYETHYTDGTAARHSYPDCVCSKPKFDVTTLSRQPKLDTRKLDITANRDIFGSRGYKKSITADVNAAVFNDWFNRIY